MPFFNENVRLQVCLLLKAAIFVAEIREYKFKNFFFLQDSYQESSFAHANCLRSQNEEFRCPSTLPAFSQHFKNRNFIRQGSRMEDFFNPSSTRDYVSHLVSCVHRCSGLLVGNVFPWQYKPAVSKVLTRFHSSSLAAICTSVLTLVSSLK